MPDKQLDRLRYLLETVETEQGTCYKTRSACTAACPFWFAGAFGENICLPSILARRVNHIGIRLKEGIKMNFKQFILPSRNKNEVLSLEKSGKIGHGLDIHFVEKITQALDFL